MIQAKTLSRKILFSVVFIAVFTIVGCSQTKQVSAAGWIGSGSAGPATSYSGTGGGGAGRDVYTMGVSWIHYKWDSGGGKHSITFAPVGGSAARTISSECASAAADGFWHFGRNSSGLGSSSLFWGWGNEPGNFGDAYYLNGAPAPFGGQTTTYTTSVGKWGHYGTYTLEERPDRVPYIQRGNLNHVLYYNGTQIYHADKSASESEALEAYKKACAATSGCKATNYIPSTTYAFCSYDNQAQFASKSSITVTHDSTKKSANSGYSSASSNSTKSESKTYTFSGGSDTFTFSTTNMIKRTDKGSGTANVKYKKYVHSDSSTAAYGSATTHSLKSGAEYTIPNSADQNALKTVIVKPGHKKTICTKVYIWRNSIVGGSTYSNDLETSKACITVIHKATAKFSSQSRITIKSKDGKDIADLSSGWNKTDKSKNIVLDSSKFKVGDEVIVRAENTIKRTDSSTIEAKNAKVQYRKYNYKQKSGGSYATAATTTLGSGKDVPFVDENITRTIGKDGTVKVCARIAISRTTAVSHNGEEITIKPASITKPNSMVCVTLSLTPINDDPEVDMGFIGETTSARGSSGYTAYTSFYVNPNIQRSGFSGTLPTRSETDLYVDYADGWSRTARQYKDTKTAENEGISELLQKYSGVRFGERGSVQNNANFTINVPDDTSYVGAKICVAGVSKVVESTSDSRKIAQTCYRNGAAIKDADGNPTGSYEQISYDCSYWEYKYTYKAHWKFSAPSCKPVAQKPNMQVTGGTLYSASDTLGIIANKTSGSRYSSWSEYLTIADGSVNSFGSGASYRGGTNDNSNQYSLTIANNSSTTGYAGVESSASQKFIDGIKDLFLDEDTPKDAKNFDITVLNDEENYINGDISSGNKQKIYFVNGDLKISPTVKQINAWLIVDGTLNTCATVDDGTNLSTKLDCNNNQLTINGLVYAKTFKLFRTIVGASTYSPAGRDPALSAETINLQPSSYVYSYKEALERSEQPKVVYTQELAPRV